MRYIPFTMRPREIDGETGYCNYRLSRLPQPTLSLDKLFRVGVRTTCKDRWRQVLNEGKRVPTKHILTIQPGISTNQFDEMHAAKVRLVVPNQLHSNYPPERSIDLLNVNQFVAEIKGRLN